MALLQVDVTRRGVFAMNDRDMKNVVKNAWVAVGKAWHRRIRKKHFTRQGAAEYNYRPRSRTYTARKRKKFHHIQPLKLTGTSERLSEVFRVVAVKDGADVRYPGLRAFNFKPPRSDINMREEFTAVSERDHETLAAVADKSIDVDLNRFNKTKRDRIR